MLHYNELSENDKAQLLKLPAYMVLLHATSSAGIDTVEKTAALNITHVKTFSCDPVLVDFYKDADKVFENVITALDSALPGNTTGRKPAIQEELEKLESILRKLEPGFVAALRRSLRSYESYIAKEQPDVMEYFVFPFSPVG